MHFAIQQANLKNLLQINRLLRASKAYWGYDEVFLDSFMEKLGITPIYLQQHSIQLFYVNSQLAGFYNFVFDFKELPELDNFFLHPDYIGQGLGRILWRRCCEEARKQGVKEFVIWSDPNAEAFYIKMGCEKIGNRPSPIMPNRYPPLLRFRLT